MGLSSLFYFLYTIYMTQFIQKNFNLPELTGISHKNIEEHLKLYAGYIKHANLILSQIEELSKDNEKNIYTIGELRRRFGFEFNGIKNHEYFFSQLEEGLKDIRVDSTLYTKISEQWGSFENWLIEFKTLAMTRGIGWAMLYHDTETDTLLNAWIDEQHLGQLATCDIILALDMWEHAYVYDYATSEKKKYVEAFFENINWSVVENRIY